MRLVERHIIKKAHPFYQEYKDLCFKSKNLYNRALYLIRQEYINNKNYWNYYAVEKYLKQNEIPEYRYLPIKSSQQTLMLLHKNWLSFFGLLKLVGKGEYENNKVNLPKYRNKDGLYPVTFTYMGFSKKYFKQGLIKLEKTNIIIKPKVNVNKIKQVRIIPRYGRFIIEVVYNKTEKELLEDNGKYAGIDIGIDNLATVGFNFGKGFIINGKPVKSINQYFNKKVAKEKSLLPKGVFTNKKIERLYLKRDNKILDYFHKASRYIINQLVSKGVNTLIIGHNKNWKQEINIGKRNNQNFVSIPFNKLIHMLTYKAQLKGIKVIETEESYTSKCSFLDNEKICKHDNYKGKRIKRGLFRTSLGRLINADLNGALNIIRKVVGEFQYSIEVCSTPVRITL